MRNKISNLIWGLIFIVIGLGIAGDVMNLWNFKLFFPGWWTMFIIIPCFISIIRSGINVGSTTGLIIGIMLLLAQYVKFNFNYWGLIVPVILIIVGLKIVFQGMGRNLLPMENKTYIEGQSGYNTNRKEYNAVFASNNIRITDQFIGTSLNAVFGGISIDLRDAIIDSDVEITATAVFAGIDIYVPRGVQVRVNNIPVFGGVSDKSLQATGPDVHTIYLNSTTMFGGIDIK